MTKFWSTDRSTQIAYIVGALAIALLIFHAGFAIGSHRHPPHGERRFGFHGAELPHGYVAGGHGAVGVVESVASSSVSLQLRDGSIETLRLTDKTTIRSSNGATSTTALTPGQHIVALGTPGADGVISADLIRIFDVDMMTPPQHQ